MKTQTIRLLALLLPEDADYFHGWAAPSNTSTFASFCDRVAKCLGDPKFAWNFASYFARHQKELPDLVWSNSLNCVKAWAFLAGQHLDPAIAEVYGLLHPSQFGIRNILNGLLISRDITIEKIAEVTGIPVNVVTLYSHLIFNVRDRFEEKAYIASLAYPHTRFAEIMGEGVESLNPGLALLRAGHNHGAEEVLFLAGLLPRPRKGKSGKSKKAELESQIEDAAVAVARHGGANKKGSTAMANAKALLLAEKAKEDPVQTIWNPFPAMTTLGFSATEELLKITESDRTEHEKARQEWHLEQAEKEKAKAHG